MVHSTPMQMVLPGLDFSPLEPEEGPLTDIEPDDGLPALEPALPVAPDIRAASLFRMAFEELKPRTAVPDVEVRFCDFAGASARIRFCQGRLAAKLSDVLEHAPEEAILSLAFILLSKLFRRPLSKEKSQPYREYLGEAEVRERIGELRRERGRKVMSRSALGVFFDLRAIFDQLNARYFGGEMRVDALGWSRQLSRTTLGHYDAAHHAIVISRLLDAARVAPVLVEFVMYHEMLHIRFPVEHVSGRRRVHTREFRAAEKQFERFAEAREAIRRLQR